MAVELGKSRAPGGLRIYAVGDIHGCLDQLRQMLAMIEHDVAINPVEDYRIIFLGDYMDRGPCSKEVIAFLMALRERNRRVICLRGNHDAMLLSFFDDPLNRKDPLKRGGIYFRNGMATTLKSYGARVDDKNLNDETVLQLPAVLKGLISDFHLEFLRSLPFSASFGDYFFCHAGIRPGLTFGDQNAEDLMWIRADFLKHQGLFEKVVIHGHTPQDDVEIRNNRVNVDTRCYDTGMLTSIVLQGTDYRFMQTN